MPDAKSDFDEVITTSARLREVLGTPSYRVTNKVIDHVDPICRRFIAASPFVLIATRGADGLMDISPKGDPAGFVKVLNAKTLAVPERPGNLRGDTFNNLLANPYVGLFFMIPGFGFTLRVAGTGQIVRDATLQADMAVNGREPALVSVITVKEAFMHCAKSITRSSIWKSGGWPDTSDVPSLAEAMVAHGELEDDHSQMHDIIERDHEDRLY